MASFDAFPIFDAALDPSMNFDWQGLLAQPSEGSSLSGPSRRYMVTSSDMYPPNPTSYDLPVASPQVTGVLGHGLVSASYPCNTSFGITDATSCAPLVDTSTEILRDLEADLLSLGFDTSPDLDFYGLSSLFYLPEPAPVVAQQPYAWPVQNESSLAVPSSEAFTFSAPTPNAVIQPSQWAPLDIPPPSYQYDQPSPQSPATSFDAGSPCSPYSPYSPHSPCSPYSSYSPYSMSSSSGSDEDSSPDEVDLPVEFSPRLPRLTERGTYKKVHAKRRDSASSNTTASSSSSGASSSSRGPSFRKPRSSRSSRSPAKPRERRASSGAKSPAHASPRAVQVPAGTAPLEPVNGACPECGYVPKNRNRKPDLERHMRIHTGSETLSWVCCGVPISQAAQYGFEHFEHEDVRFVEYLNMPMIGGCGQAFSRKDALQRHLGRATKGCKGDANGDWYPEAKSRRAKTA